MLSSDYPAWSELPNLTAQSSGMLFTIAEPKYAFECALAAALVRARRSSPEGSGVDAKRPLHITALVDPSAQPTMTKFGFDQLGLYDRIVRLPSAHGWAKKIVGAMSSPYTYTIAADCDVAVMWGEGPRDLLRLVSDEYAGAEFIMTETWGSPGQNHDDVLSHGNAAACAGLFAFARTARVQALFTAALGLFNKTSGPFMPGYGRRSDQEAYWAVLFGQDHRLSRGSRPRVRVLPIEWQCPKVLPIEGVKLESPPGVNYLPRPCRFTHWHPHTFRQAAEASSAFLSTWPNGPRLLQILLPREATASNHVPPPHEHTHHGK